jgi:hypothetical protein
MGTPGKRSPTAHRTPEQIRRHNRTYGAKKAVMEKDKEGHRLRRQAIKEGRVRKGEDKDVHHVKPSVKGGADSKANTRIVSASKNRGHGMSPGGTRAGTGRRGGKRKR